MTVGVLGGMGPDATVDFMHKVIALTDATRDQDHLHLLVDHNPTVPDRQAAMHGDDSGVRRALAEMARRLEGAGAEFLVMPCNTAHAFYAEARDAVSIPFIDIVEVTVAEIGKRQPAAERVGVLATDACLIAGLYQDAIEASGRRVVLPGERQQRRLMEAIDRVKAGDQGEQNRREMQMLAAAIVRQGAQAVVAGCTEIPLVLEQGSLEAPLYSSTDILAQKTIAIATGDEPLRS